MSWKAIDLQMAVHRSGDAGLQQSQFVNKPADDRAALAQQSVKQTIEEGQRPAKTPEPGEAGIHERQGQAGASESKNKKQSNGKAEETAKGPEDIPHPYKGKHIDLHL